MLAAPTRPTAPTLPIGAITGRTEAVPRLRAAWDEHTQRYPERTRATSRTEAGGTWVSGEHRRLDPEQNTEASKAQADR
jgi:hypothetical protein